MLDLLNILNPPGHPFDKDVPHKEQVPNKANRLYLFGANENPRWLNLTSGCRRTKALPGHLPSPSRRIQTVPPQQFQVLFHSLFKVLFTFPSRYLCAIGLGAIFSFTRGLPGILGLHSQATRLCERKTLRGQTAFERVVRDYHPQWCTFPGDLDSLAFHQTTFHPETTTPMWCTKLLHKGFQI